MSETTTNLTFEVNTVEYLAINTGATWEDLVKDCVLPKFKTELSNLCRYVDIAYSSSVTYPAIAIPWLDGTVDGGLLIYFGKNKTLAVGANQDYPHLAIGANIKELKIYTVAQDINSDNYSGTIISNYKPSEYNFVFRTIFYEDFMQIGVKEISPSAERKISCPYIITSFDKGGTSVNGGFVTNSQGEARLTLYTYENGQGIDRPFILQQAGVSTNAVALACKIDDGLIKNDYFYLVSGYYMSCRGAWCDNTTRHLLVQEDYEKNLFYKNAFTINGQSLDALILTSPSIKDNTPYPIVCRKHID